jgi:phospholipid transport system substrate-binding protein
MIKRLLLPFLTVFAFAGAAHAQQAADTSTLTAWSSPWSTT